MKHLLILASLFSNAAFAESNCYKLSRDGVAWSKTPELLCVDEGQDESKITLESGFPNRQIIAHFNLQLLQRARCIDCNKDIFGVSLPSNSIFNTLKIEFDGEGVRGSEVGKVLIGKNEFHYRSL